MNAEDLLTGDRTFTVARAEVDMSKERPVSIWFEEFPKGRPFKPSLTVSRIFAKLWGEEESEYPGRKVTLYRDETVKWAGQQVGGIRVRAMSHIGKKAVSITLAESQNKRAPWTILPLADDAATSPALSENEVALNSLRNEWKTADPERKKAIEAEVAALSGKPATADPGDVETPDPADELDLGSAS
jgi:hypothetical protein